MKELLKTRIYLAGAWLILLIADGALVVGALEVDHHPHSPAHYLLALAGAAAGLLWTPAVTGPAAARYRLAKHQTRCPGPHTPMTPAATKC
jgi:hypothetical protein